MVFEKYPLLDNPISADALYITLTKIINTLRSIGSKIVAISFWLWTSKKEHWK